MLSRVKSTYKYFLYSAVILVTIVAFILIIQIIATQLIKKVFINVAGSKLDKKVEIDGKFKVNYSLSPSLHIVNLKILNNGEWNKKEFATVGSILLKIELLPIIKGKIYIDKFNIENVVINLEKGTEGNTSWNTNKEKKKADRNLNLPDHIAVKEFHLTNLLINYHDLKSNSKKTLEISNTEISLPKDNNLKANLKGEYLETSVELNMSGGSYNEFKNPELYWPFKLDGTFISNSFKLEGKLKNPLNPENLEFNFNLYGKKLINSETILSRKLPVVDEYGISFNFKRNVETYTITDLKVTSDQSIINGNLFLERSDKLNKINGTIESDYIDLSPYFNLLADTYNSKFEKYEGNLNSLSLNFEGSGKSIYEFINTSTAELKVSNLNLFKFNIKTDKYEEYIYISSANINLDESENANLKINGSITSYPLKIRATGCNKNNFLSGENCRINLNVNYGSSEFLIDGFIQNSENYINANINSELIIPNIEEYEFIFDVPPNYNLPANLKLQLTKSETDILIKNVNLKIGQSDLLGEFEKKYIKDQYEYKIALFSNLLNFNELLEIMPKSDDTRDKDPSMHVQIFPKNLLNYQAYIKIDIKNLIFKELELKNILIDSQISDNLEKKSAFTANHFDATFGGQFDLDLSLDLPEARFKIKSKDADIGKISKDLRFADNVNFKTEKLNLLINVKGSTLDEIIRYSSLTVDIENGIYKVEDLNTKKSFDIVVEKGHLNLYADKPIILTLNGLINNQTVNIHLEANHLIRTYSAFDKGKVLLKLSLNLDDAEIILEGFVTFPLNRKKSVLKLSVSGKKLSNFNKLLDLDLPDKGPYKLECDFNVTDDGYLLKNLTLYYVDTELNGYLNIITSGSKPLIQITLESKVLDLDHFFKGSKEHKKPQERPSKDFRHSEQTLGLPDLDNFDATLDFRINKIVLNQKDIGNAEIKGNIENGKLEVNPATINILDSVAKFEIKGEDVNDQLEISMNGSLKKYDYSLLIKQLQPESKSSGILDMAINIDTKGNSFKDLVNNLNGELELNIKPVTMDAGIIDLWAHSLFHNLTSRWVLNIEDKPKVNCLTGKLKVKNGILSPHDFNLDTTNVRVKIVGNINITNDKINLLFKPIPKKPQLFSLGIPIRVVGTFENHHIIIDLYNVGWYIARLGYSGMEYTMKFFGKKYIPADGSDICNKDIINN